MNRHLIILISLCNALLATRAIGQDIRNPSVGMTGRVQQLVLPGSELVARPLDDDRIPVVVRITAAYPHGTNMRYDIEFYGLEPGDFDLRDYLIRADGSSTANVPEIPITIQSILPPGQILPNTLENRGLPWLGGYQIAAIMFAVLWSAVFLMLIFMGRKKKASRREASRDLTLEDYLKPRLEAAIAGQLDKQQYAELERMVIALMKIRLGFGDLDTSAAVRQLRNHELSGPLLTQLERWMHEPGKNDDVDLSELLKPFRDMPLDEVEVNSSS